MLVLLGVFCSSAAAWGSVIEILPSSADATCDEKFENIANSLLPGDMLILRGDIYS